jgi:hypothetical protein
MMLPSGRYLQGEGVTPTISIADGEDALTKALEMLAQPAPP